MAKISHILLFLFLSHGTGFSEQGKVKIIVENGYYYTQLETSETYKIIGVWEPQSKNTITLSPDQEYVAYTTSNFLGFESEGRDVYYCKVDGSEKTFLHRFQNCINTLLWQSLDRKSFIFVIPKNCETYPIEVQVIDYQSRQVIFSFVGDSLVEIRGTNCYQVYYQGKPPLMGRQKICLQDLQYIKEPDSINVGFFTSWDAGDIYISTQREPALKLIDLPELSRGLGKDFGKFLKGRYFYVPYIIPTQQDDRIVFIGEASSLGLFGVFDLDEKKLLSLDYSDDQRFLNASWSPDGDHFAVVRLSNWRKYIDFYKINEKGKVNFIRTNSMSGDGQLSDFKWSNDSKTFYCSYLLSNSQKVPYIIDVEDK